MLSRVVDFLKENYMYIIIAIVAIIAVVVLIKSFKKENFYNQLTRKDIQKILSKDCVISLADYINISNSTNNLKTISLQDLCNNEICLDFNDFNNSINLQRLIKTITGEFIMKCIKSNDTYRLALINLKINDMLSSQNIENMPIFKRSLTNGVYTAESVTIYMPNMSEKIKVKDMVNLYLEKLPKLKQNEEEIIQTIQNNSLNKKDADLYRLFMNNFVNKIQMQYLLENKENNSFDFSINLFDIISTITLLDVFVLQSLEC
jgi:hypothetical protein